MAMRQQLEGGTGPGRTALGVSDGGKGMRVARQGVAHLWLLRVGEAGRVVASICMALCVPLIAQYPPEVYERTQPTRVSLAQYPPERSNQPFCTMQHCILQATIVRIFVSYTSLI